jgi:hypothetical protein
VMGSILRVGNPLHATEQAKLLAHAYVNMVQMSRPAF